jgi:hypothetical protein
MSHRTVKFSDPEKYHQFQEYVGYLYPGNYLNMEQDEDTKTYVMTFTGPEVHQNIIHTAKGYGGVWDVSED